MEWDFTSAEDEHSTFFASKTFMVFRGGNYKIHVVVLNLPMHEPLS